MTMWYIFACIRYCDIVDLGMNSQPCPHLCLLGSLFVQQMPPVYKFSMSGLSQHAIKSTIVVSRKIIYVTIRCLVLHRRLVVNVGAAILAPWHHLQVTVTHLKTTVMLVKHRADSRFAPSKWETALLCNDVSHLLGTSLESTLKYILIPDFQISYSDLTKW